VNSLLQCGSLPKLLVGYDELISLVEFGDIVMAAESRIEAVAAQCNKKITWGEGFNPKGFPAHLLSLEGRFYSVNLKHPAKLNKRR
jgi:hypothetical protein